MNYAQKKGKRGIFIDVTTVLPPYCLGGDHTGSFSESWAPSLDPSLAQRPQKGQRPPHNSGVLQSMKQMMPASNFDLATWLLVFFLFGAIWLMFGMIKPFLDAIIIAALLAIVINPVYHRLLVLLRGRQSLAALLISILLTILIVIPSLFLVWQFLQETTAVFQALVKWTGTDTFQEFMKKPVVVRLSCSHHAAASRDSSY